MARSVRSCEHWWHHSITRTKKEASAPPLARQTPPRLLALSYRMFGVHRLGDHVLRRAFAAVFFPPIGEKPRCELPKRNRREGNQRFPIAFNRPDPALHGANARPQKGNRSWRVFL